MGDCEGIEGINTDAKNNKLEYQSHLDLENEFLDEHEESYDEDQADVYTILAQKEKDLLLAAELGKALLEKNEELTQKYDRLQEEYCQQAEEVEQEKHELRLKIERIGRSHDSRVHELQADIQSLRNELRSLKSASLTDSASKRKTFAGLTEENERLNSESCQLKDDNEALKEELTNIKRKQLPRSFSIDDIHNQQIEFEELCEKLTRIEEEKNYLRQNVEELLSNKEILAKDIEEVQTKNQELNKDYKDIKNQLEVTEEKLNESKTVNLYLQDQLDEMKIQASLDQASRGSLFAELSDMAISPGDGNEVSPGKTKENGHHLSAVSSPHGSSRPQAASSPPVSGSLSSNKRPRQYASVDSDDDEESDDSDLEYDESDVEIDGFVARNVEFYAQLEEQQKVNAELKKEIIDAHNELRVCYDKLRLSHADNRATKVEPLDPCEQLESGKLTSFVQIFKEILEDIIKTQKKNTLTRKNSGYAGCMVGNVSDNVLDQIRQLKEDLYEAYKEMEHLKENTTNRNKLKQKESEISALNEKLQDSSKQIKHLQEERKRLVLKECDPNLAFDPVFRQALQDKEDALRRECETALELEKTKRDAGRLDKQLMEAIQQKIELSEQLEEWQSTVGNGFKTNVLYGGIVSKC
ncbi:hypothetical protein QZH41_010563 [Actinostola sp. cb2023]|nr:hypothetical protein QZH41_010563 [Actinostola sp. cb2023]